MAMEPGTQPQPVVKRDRWASFRGLTWWQVGLSVLPLVLLVGGLVGGAAGAGAMVVNLWLAKRQLGGAVKALAMIGVDLVAVVVYVVVAGVIYALTHPA